jgi:hypothetical protein
MKKKTIIALSIIALTLVSCGKKDTKPSDTTVTTDTEIDNKEQSAKVCAPFIKYLECSLEKAPDIKKSVHQKILDDTKKKIENDEPARIAQQCDTYLKILKDNPDIAFKNGCSLDTPPVTQPSK